MTQAQLKPQVELRFHPTDLDPETLRAALKPLGSPSEAIEAALLAARMMVITQAKAEVAAITGEISAARLIGAADLAWQIYAPTLVKSLGPVFADQYLRSLRAAGAGEIPMATVYALADQHASRVGTYFHTSSRDALAQGFTTFINRRVAERTAADRVLDAYGLTGRGMSGFTSRALDKADTVTPLSLKQRVGDYIGTSVRKRSRLFARQEEHNISQQAQQIAWMWLQDKGKISPNSEKLWITARDEKVCPQCGPMHGTKVLLNERFTLPNGSEMWVPGVHPNCRCQVRLLSHPWMAETSKSLLFGKATAWNPTEHPRGGDPENKGRFSAKARSAPRPKAKPVTEADREDLARLQAFLDQAERAAAKVAHQEALESVLDEPKIKLGAAEPRIKLGTGQRIKLGTQAKLGEKIKLGTGEKIRLGAGEAKPKLGTATGEKVKLKIRPEQKLLISDDTRKAFLAYNEKARWKPRAPEPGKRRRRKTVLITDEQGGVRPVYYILSPMEGILEGRDDQKGVIELHDEMEFSAADEEQLAMMAGQHFDQEINDHAEAINDNAENKITQVFGDGRKFVATVDANDTYDVVAYAAHQGRVALERGDPGADWLSGAKKIPVTWQEVNPDDPDDIPLEDGEEYSDEVGLAEVAEEWRLEPDMFDIKVLVLTEGHKGRRGDTEQVNFKHPPPDQPEKRVAGYDSWITSGLYKMTERNRIAYGAGVPIEFVELDPLDPEITEEDEPGVGWKQEYE